MTIHDIQAVALWFVTPDQKVLLQKKYFTKYRMIIHQPPKTSKNDYESKEGAIARLLKKELEKIFPDRSSHLRFSLIKSEPFSTDNRRQVIRHHLRCQLPFQPFVAFPEEDLIFVDKKDTLIIKKISDNDKDTERNLVMFDFDQQVLFEILGVQQTLITW